MSYGLEEYLKDLDTISEFLINNPFVNTSNLLIKDNEKVTAAIKSTTERANEFRATIIDKNDLARIRPLVESITDDELKKRNIAYFTFILDLQEWQKEKEIRLRYKLYEINDPIFIDTDLWNKRTTNEGFTLREQGYEDEIDDEIIKIKGKYYRTDRSLNSETIRFLKKLFAEFPTSKLWLRLSCKEKYNTKPSKLLLEEVSFLPINYGGNTYLFITMAKDKLQSTKILISLCLKTSKDIGTKM